MAWLTGSVKETLFGNGLNCLYNCTAASNLRGMSQPPYPLSFKLRFPLPDSARATRRWIILYLEYQSVCPFVRIGSFRPLSHKRVLPTLWFQGGRDNTRLWERGRSEPTRTTGERAWHSVYSVYWLISPVHMS